MLGPQVTNTGVWQKWIPTTLKLHMGSQFPHLTLYIISVKSACEAMRGKSFSAALQGLGGDARDDP